MPTNRRYRRMLAGAAAVFIAAYAAFFVHVVVTHHLSEIAVRAPKDAQDAAVRVLMTAEAVETSLPSVRFRLDIDVSKDFVGATPGTSARDFTVLVDDDVHVREVQVTVGKPIVPTTLQVTIETSRPGSYPFDVYRGKLRIKVFTGVGVQPDGAQPIATTFYIWSAVAPFDFDGTMDPASTKGNLIVDFTARRTDSIRVFAAMIYAAMLAIAAASLAVSINVFLGRKPLEFPMFTWLATSLFAIPTVRNILPGNPPIGVTADLLILLWAIVAEAVSMALVFATWVRPSRDP